MLEKISIALMAIAMCLLVAAGVTEDRTVAAVFMIVYAAAMIGLGFTKLRKHLAQRKSKPKKPEKSLSEDAASNMENAVKALEKKAAAGQAAERYEAARKAREERAAQLKEGNPGRESAARTDGSRKTEAGKILFEEERDGARVTAETTEDENVVCLRYQGEGGYPRMTAYLTKNPAKYTNSAFWFLLEHREWPHWAVRALCGWKEITQYVSDRAAPDSPGRIYWENAGDLSRYYRCLWFEKANDKWKLVYKGNGKQLNDRMFDLTGATDDDIARYLDMSPDAFWRHPVIREMRSAAEKPAESAKAASGKEERLSAMLETLDKELESIGMDREKLLKSVAPAGDARFDYTKEYGYRLQAVRDRANPVVICRNEDEAAFRASVMEKAKQVQLYARARERRPGSSRHSDLLGYGMSDAEKEICARMEKRLDEALAAMGTGRDFLIARHFGPGAPEFGYSDKRGYFCCVMPERSDAVVTAVNKDEEEFIACHLREAAEYMGQQGKKAVLLTLTHSWGGKAEHGEDQLELVYHDNAYRLEMTERYWNDYRPSVAPSSTVKKETGKLKGTDTLHWTASGFLFHAKTLLGLPGWAAEYLGKRKVFTGMFIQDRNEKQAPGLVWWSRGGVQREKWHIWFEKKDGKWTCSADVELPDKRINKTTPLPAAKDEDIARCLELDPAIYLHSPDIEHWIIRDGSAEVSLYQKEEERPHGTHVERFDIDTRNGALYFTEGNMAGDGKNDTSRKRPARFGELIARDKRYEAMELWNWRQYLPKEMEKKKPASPKRTAMSEVMDTFTEEERKQLAERLYQYSQDVQRGGTEPEIAAANRNLVFADGRTVPREVAERMEQMKREKSAKRPEKKFKMGPNDVELYRHERKGFYDEESSVTLFRKSPEEYGVFISWDTPNMNDHTQYDLPQMMIMKGCTRGELLAWLKQQKCVISFPEKDLNDGTMMIPRPQLMIAKILPPREFGREIRVIEDRFYPGSSSQHKITLRGEGGVVWLHHEAYWKHESGNRSVDAVLRDDSGHLAKWMDATLKISADKLLHGGVIGLFQSVSMYHEDIDTSIFGEAKRTVCDEYNMGHDGPDWKLRRRSITLHEAKGDWYAVERLDYVHGILKKEWNVVTTAKLHEGMETAPDWKIMDAFHCIEFSGVENRFLSYEPDEQEIRELRNSSPVRAKIEDWDYLIEMKDGKLSVWHHVTRADGGYGTEVKLSFPADYVKKYGVSKLWSAVAPAQNCRPGEGCFDRLAEEKELTEQFRARGWI
ncbi:MAG: hypothetical protein IJE08_08090 [Clostridia bacterium]|nr:hypothetical protein [Clostridia bacterium]